MSETILLQHRRVEALSPSWASGLDDVEYAYHASNPIGDVDGEQVALLIIRRKSDYALFSTYEWVERVNGSQAHLSRFGAKYGHYGDFMVPFYETEPVHGAFTSGGIQVFQAVDWDILR